MDDGSAFEAFVRSSGSSLLRTALLITGDRGAAEDVLQTALTRVARRWRRVSDSPEPYARRVVINAAIDEVRHRRARPLTLSGLDLGDEHVPEVRDEQRVELRHALVAALQTLPPRQRSVLVCRYVLDLDERATADALGISIGTVKSSASRGLATLRTNATQLALTPEG